MIWTWVRARSVPKGNDSNRPASAKFLWVQTCARSQRWQDILRGPVQSVLYPCRCSLFCRREHYWSLSHRRLSRDAAGDAVMLIRWRRFVQWIGMSVTELSGSSMSGLGPRPLWVKSRYFATQPPCPLYPRERIFKAAPSAMRLSAWARWSLKQIAVHALQRQYRNDPFVKIGMSALGY